MKAFWFILLAVLVGCGLGSGVMWQKEAARATALADLVTKMEAENTKLSQDLATATENAKTLESESAQLRAARAISGARLAPNPSDASDAEESPRPKPQSGFLAKMFKDPEMRKMLAAQQTSALRGFYSDFVKQAHLTPDEADRFFSLLQDRQMALMDSSANMMSGSAVDLKAASAAATTSDDAIKSLLGPDRFGQYQSFEKTLGDRIQVQQFSQQLGSTGAPLQDYQSQALIQIMSQERATLPSFQSNSGAGLAQGISMTPDQISQYSQQIDAMNQRVYNRALSVLTPPQLSAFAAFQKNLATVQVAGLKMTQQMFKGDQ
jgi:hypothetical protein